MKNKLNKNTSLFLCIKNRIYLTLFLIVLLVMAVTISFFNGTSNKPSSKPTNVSNQIEPKSYTSEEYNKPSNKPPNVSNPVEQKIYTSKKYNFQISYPKNWKVEVKDSQIKSLNIIPVALATEPLNFYYLIFDELFSVNITDPQNPDLYDDRNIPGSLSVIVNKISKDYWDLETGKTIKDINEFEEFMKRYYKKGRIVQRINLSEKEAVYSRRNLEATDFDTQYAAYDGYEEEVDLFYNDLVYTIICNGKWYKNYCNQFFSSFKFLDK